MPKKTKKTAQKGFRTDWDPLAVWYDGWVGESGSKHHRFLAIPAVLDLLDLEPGMKILDMGCGQGVLCPHITEAGGSYVGVDLSNKLIQIAKNRFQDRGKFLIGDGLSLSKIDGFPGQPFDAVAFLLSLQDMNPLGEAVRSAAQVLREGGKIVILMTHPCFRIPRQSGWGWDENRKLRYRRLDSYLSRLEVPLKAYPGKEKGVTRSFHRPLQEYFSALSENRLVVDRLVEIPTYKQERTGENARAVNRSNREIPLFLGLRALKLPVNGG
jgi:SAM-dependent methyltransferase